MYLTSTHTEVIGQIQRVVLIPGLLRPDIEILPEDQADASYDFKIINSGGELIDFNKFHGQTVFINFWATWCAPCIAEMPGIQNLYDEVGQEVVFVMISLDAEPQKTWEFANKKGFSFPVYRMGTMIPQVYERQVIPTTYVIAPNGKIVSERHGMAKYNTDSFRDFLLAL
ncbi:MAG: TlpA disulfide reductase family protein [Bacteroidetes bacterium]|nr:TlpA disulfide reductase family protein [Bacteroidota bacterium]